jgi:hypothetical protein
MKNSGMRSLLVRSNTISHRYACTVCVFSMHARYVCAVCMRGDTMHAPQDTEQEDVDQIGEKPGGEPQATASTRSNTSSHRYACTVYVCGMHARH